MKRSSFDATISALDAETSALDVETCAFGAAMSAIALRLFDATISALDAETSALGAETSALGAETSAIARSYRRYRRGLSGDIGDCGVGITPQMCNRVTNHRDTSTFSKPAFKTEFSMGSCSRRHRPSLQRHRRFLWSYRRSLRRCHDPCAVAIPESTPIVARLIKHHKI